jgi:hypothetical protein
VARGVQLDGVQADVFTLPKLYECCPNYLYLYQHCALKGVPEAIDEGMDGVWDRCARPERHISFEAGMQEAVVCWNAPKPHHADANDFLKRALSLHFKGAAWHFTHTSAATTRCAKQSKVLQRLAKHGPKLPGSLWKTVSHCARQAALRRLPAPRCLLTTVSRLPPRACPSGHPRARLPCAHCTVTPDTDEELRAVCCEAPQRRRVHIFDHNSSP